MVELKVAKIPQKLPKFVEQTVYFKSEAVQWVQTVFQKFGLHL